MTKACELISDQADEDALIIFGTCFNSDADDEIRVTVVATGFQNFDDGLLPDYDRSSDIAVDNRSALPEQRVAAGTVSIG